MEVEDVEEGGTMTDAIREEMAVVVEVVVVAEEDTIMVEVEEEDTIMVVAETVAAVVDLVGVEEEVEVEVEEARFQEMGRLLRM